jgi:hypothetical protein
MDDDDVYTLSHLLKTLMMGVAFGTIYVCMYVCCDCCRGSVDPVDEVLYGLTTSPQHRRYDSTDVFDHPGGLQHSV